MHVVGDFQRQPSKKRHVSEKVIGSIYDIIIGVKYITFLVFVSTVTIAASRTFASGFWSPDGYELSPILKFKLQSCSYTTIRDVYAFKNVSFTLNANNNSELFTDFGGQMRTLVILAGVALLLGAANRELFRHNRFFLRYRHMYFHKDVITTCEVLLLALIFYTTFHLDQQQGLLTEYLQYCGVLRTSYLPFASLTTMYVFVGSGVTSFIVAFVVLLVNVFGRNVQVQAFNPRDPTEHANLHNEPEDADSATTDSQVGEAEYNDNMDGGEGGGYVDEDEMLDFVRSQSSLGGSNNPRYTPTAQRGQQQRSYLQHRPSPLLPHGNHNTNNRRSATRGRTDPWRSGAASPNALGGAAGGAPSGAEGKSSTFTTVAPPTATTATAPAPPPPHESFYLYQQPARM